MPISFQSRIQIPGHVLTRELDGELLILNLNNESYYGLDNTGTRFLAVLKESNTIQDAYDALLEEFDVEPETLRKDLEMILEKLQKNGVVKILDPAS